MSITVRNRFLPLRTNAPLSYKDAQARAVAQAALSRPSDFDQLFDELARIIEEDESAATPASPRIAGVYIISVAARLARMHPQTLRKYDREDLVNPSRTGGMLRLYSAEDVERLLIIGRLVDDLGLNVEGVRLVLGMVDVLKEVIEVLERSSEVAGTRTARLAAQELRRLIEYTGQSEPSSPSGRGQP